MKSLSILIICGLFVSVSNGQDKQSSKKKPKKVNPAMAPVTDVEGLPRVLLIGDSISIGYTPGVRKLLEGKANVHRPLTNCGPTIRGVEKIESWLETGGKGKKWDVIHFNWGLHDLKYMGAKGQNLADPKAKDSVQQVPPAEYEANLRKLTARLKETGAKVIWRNTTPVPEGAKGRVVGHSAAYNEIASKVMSDLDVPTHDLFSVSQKRMNELMRKADVHFTTKGNEVLSADVAKTILSALK